MRWADAYDGELVPSDTFFYLEVPVLTQCRAWIASGTRESLEKALGRLLPVRRQVEALHFIPQMIEVLVLQAVALEKKGHTEEAHSALDEVIALAAPRGFVRPFIEAGPTMAELLDRAGGRMESPDFARHLLAVFENRDRPSPIYFLPARPPSSPPVAIDSLTNRQGRSRAAREAPPRQRDRGGARRFLGHGEPTPQADLSQARGEQSEEGGKKSRRVGNLGDPANRVDPHNITYLIFALFRGIRGAWVHAKFQAHVDHEQRKSTRLRFRQARYLPHRNSGRFERRVERSAGRPVDRDDGSRNRSATNHPGGADPRPSRAERRAHDFVRTAPAAPQC